MINDIERDDIEVEGIEKVNPGPTIQELQDEINDLRQTIKDQNAEIENIRTDNSVLKETIVRMQIKNVGLMG